MSATRHVTVLRWLRYTVVKCSSLSSVKVNLSNGHSSPIFKDEDYSHYNKETITFDPNRPFNSIAAYDGPSNTGLIRFMDSSETKFMFMTLIC